MPTSPTRRDRHRAGFSLIELLVVLVVLALAASLVAPPLGAALGIGSMRTETVKVTTALREARATAMVSGRPVDFVVESASAWRVDGDRHVLRGQMTLALEVPPAGRGTDGRPFIRFFADGRSTGGTVLVRDGSRRRAVVVEWLTGHVHAEE